jgi:alcohol dehydrogenase
MQSPKQHQTTLDFPTEMVGFDSETGPRIIYGLNVVDDVGVHARELSSNGRVLLVTDPGVEEAGHPDRVERSLKASGLEVTWFDKVVENPTTHEVNLCVQVAKEAGIDTLIGLGGGSAMDTAKGCNFLLTNGGHMKDYWGVGLAAKPMLPMIAIPTTAGTGSECQSFALIADEITHRKMACGDPKAMPRVSILDPTLTVTQPNMVAANTGLDAIAHAVETAVTTKRNDLSLKYSHQAFQLTQTNLPRVLEQPDDLEARGLMQIGAAFAGTAIENSMLGIAHSLANPLTAHYGVIHGQAVGVMMPHVVRFNGQDPAILDLYFQLAQSAGLANVGDDPAQALEALACRLEQLLDITGITCHLSEHGVELEKLPQLAKAANEQWTAQFNPRQASEQDLLELYQAAWK